jgi:hypothetical protein
MPKKSRKVRAGKAAANSKKLLKRNAPPWLKERATRFSRVVRRSKISWSFVRTSEFILEKLFSALGSFFDRGGGWLGEQRKQNRETDSVTVKRGIEPHTFRQRTNGSIVSRPASNKRN